ncbi:hypothetical protein M9Y10_029605 [Tritrichomonas musculus]|uniref:Uncharacterized protein n=1 Tax=Tritrichomonas musculus TaxID=1915356 RepID=A0ABR2KMM7_9EUKA
MPAKPQNTTSSDPTTKYKTEVKKVLTLTNKAIVSTSLKEKNDILLNLQELFTPLYESFEKHQTILRIKNDELNGLRKKLSEAQNQKDTLQRNTAFYFQAEKVRTIHNENRLIDSIKDLEEQILQRNQLAHPDRLSESLELPENSDQRLFSLIDLNLQRIEELAYAYKKRLIVVEESQESTEVVLRDYGSINHLLSRVQELEDENEKLKQDEKVFIHDAITKRRKFAQMTPTCARDMITVFKNFIKADKSTIQSYFDEEFSVDLDDSTLDFDNVSADDGFKEEPSHFEASDFGNTTEPEMITPIIENDDLSAKVDAFKKVISSVEATDAKISNEIASIPNHYDNRKYATVSHIDKLAESNEKILGKIHTLSSDLDTKNQEVIDISGQIFEMTKERKNLMQFYVHSLGDLKRLTESHIIIIQRQALNKTILTLLFQLCSSFGIYMFNNPLKKKKKVVKHKKNKNSSENKNSIQIESSTQNLDNNQDQKEKEEKEKENSNVENEQNKDEPQNDNQNDNQNQNENENDESNKNDKNSEEVQNSEVIQNSNSTQIEDNSDNNQSLNSNENATNNSSKNSALGSSNNLLTNSRKNSALGSSNSIRSKNSGRKSALGSLKDVPLNPDKNSSTSSAKNVSNINSELSSLPPLANNSGKNSALSSAKNITNKISHSRLASIQSAKCLAINLGKNSALSSAKNLNKSSNKNSALNSTKSLPPRANSLKNIDTSIPIETTEANTTNPEPEATANNAAPVVKDDDLTLYLKATYQTLVQKLKEIELENDQNQNKNLEEEKQANAESHPHAERVTADEFHERLLAMKKKKVKHSKQSGNNSILNSNSNTTSRINVSPTVETESATESARKQTSMTYDTPTDQNVTAPTANDITSQADLTTVTSSPIGKGHFLSSRQTSSPSELFLRRPRIEVLHGLSIAAEVAGFTYGVDKEFMKVVSKMTRDALGQVRSDIESQLQEFGNPFNEQIAQINMSANRILVKQKEAIAIQTDVQPLIEEETQTQQINNTKQKAGKKK